MEKKWWKESVVYQIYPRSFKDSNHDGIGDLRGIIEKIEYLVWLGVKAVWLNPVYDSPNDDMGYDIRDYEKIMSEFGTREDFDLLLETLHKHDIKLIMDLVVNHSSDEHHWFVESRKSKDNPYRDYYFWKKGNGFKEPNNWASFFTPSAWTYDELTEEWYLHLFSEKQPDLNWDNPALREEIYSMINRWFDKGVDGFRMDVINLIAKKEGLPDGSKPTDGPYVFSDEHFAMQPKLHEHLQEMRRRCFDHRNCMCVGETPFVNTSNASSLIETGRELDLLFHFELMDIDSRNGKWDYIPFNIMKFKKLMNSWQEALSWNSLFWSNHDQPRTVSRFGDDSTEFYRVQSAKMLGVAMHFLKGTSFVFQGEELGMTNYPFTKIEELRDIESLQFIRNATKGDFLDFAWKGILKKGRDNARTPMQWDDSLYSGFSDVLPWISVNPNYSSINVETEMNNPDSILHFYQKMISLKTKSEVLIYGDYEPLFLDNEAFFAYIRRHEDKQIIVICNMTKNHVHLDYPKEWNHQEVILSNYENYDVLFQPYEVRVINLVQHNE
ncbi:MAG: alpha-glucosidase [Firmicutes bacterium]|nr:alpha-glucosidase [Bacillota bacterium]